MGDGQVEGRPSCHQMAESPSARALVRNEMKEDEIKTKMKWWGRTRHDATRRVGRPIGGIEVWKLATRPRKWVAAFLEIFGQARWASVGPMQCRAAPLLLA